MLSRFAAHCLCRLLEIGVSVSVLWLALYVGRAFAG